MSPLEKFPGELVRRPPPYCCTTCTSSCTKAPTACLSSCPRNQVALAVTRVPLVAATPLPGAMTTLHFLGGVNPGVGSNALILGYHSASTGASFCSAQSFMSGALDVSMVISAEPSVVRITNGGAGV